MLRRLRWTPFLLLVPAPAWAQAANAVASYGWLSLLPPLVAIGTALVLRTVLPALFLGVWLGAWLLAGFDLAGLGQGFLDTAGIYILDAIADRDHAAVIVFSLMIGGLIGIIAGNGGTRGILELIVRWVHTRRRGQFATVLMGFVLFIDDYANVLIVGNTMRPITDSLKISRAEPAPVEAMTVQKTRAMPEAGRLQIVPGSDDRFGD
jgi:Na+/H+ antiporter NhaC